MFGMNDDDDPLFGGEFQGGDPFSSGNSRAPPRVPCSIICGFLGAGKTTVVQHILRNRENLKVGIVVNDIAEANVDSAVLSFEDADGIIGLQNGCVCCSGRDDLFTRLLELVESEGTHKLTKGWDRLVVECSGVAEPVSIAQELEAMAKRGEPLLKRTFLAGIICVIDASTFDQMLHAPDSAETPELAARTMPLAALLVSQVEEADTIVISKCDLVEPSALQELKSLLKSLNSRAQQLEAVQGNLPLRQLLPAEPVPFEMPAYVPTLEARHAAAVKSASSAHGHGHGHGSCSHGHGHGSCATCPAPAQATNHDTIQSFVYSQDRLFDAAKLVEVLCSLPVSSLEIASGWAEGPMQPNPAPRFDGLLRSKGFLHVSGDDRAYYWSHAGQCLQVTAVGKPSASSEAQELVFIGIGLDEPAIRTALDSCLTI